MAIRRGGERIGGPTDAVRERLDVEKRTTGEAPDFVEGLTQRLASVVRGAQRDPLTDFVVDRVTEVAPGIDPADVDRFAARAGSTTVDRVLELAGEFGPTILAGAGLFSLGRAAAVRGLGAVAPRLASGGGRLAGQASRVAARAEDFAGRPGLPIPKPALERGAEIAGGSAGIGGLEGAREAAAGGTPREVARQAAFGAALAGTFETGLTVAGKALIPRAREVDVGRIERNVRRPEVQQAFRAVEERFSNRVERLRRAVGEALGVDDQAREIRAFAGGKRGRAPIARERLFTPEATQAIRKFKEARASREALRRLQREAPVPVNYTRDAPFNPEGMLLEVQQVMAKVAKTPEAFGGELGRVGGRALQAVGEAEAETVAARATGQAIAARMTRTASHALGIRARSKRFVPAVRDAFRVFEEEGLETASRRFPGMRPVFEEVRRLRPLYDRLVSIGAEPALRSEDLAEMGVREFVPHVLEDLGESEFRRRFLEGVRRRLQRQGLDSEAAAMTAARFFDRVEETRNGLARFGSIDFQRQVAGSLASKVDDGMPFVANPIEAVERYAAEVGRRFAYGRRFGFRGELKDAIVSMVDAEGGSRALANTLFDSFLARKYYRQSLRRTMQSLASAQTASKLTFAVIPNMSQSVNTILFSGFRNTLRGMMDTLSGTRRNTIEQALGLHESVFQALRRSHIAASSRENALDRIADATLRMTGFSGVERFNRYLGGAAAYHFIRDTTAKALTGRLRGRSLDAARRRMGHLFLDLDAITRRGRPVFERTGSLDRVLREAVGEEAIDRALFRGARLTQFSPDVTSRPVFWSTPVGRVLFQFKTFALSQGRFLRDQVAAEAARGNMKPLATFLAIYPVAGELVETAVSALRDKRRERDHVARFVEDVTAVGGFGLASSAYLSARFGRLEEFLAGPSGSDFLAVGESLLTADSSRLEGTIRRQPLAEGTRLLMEPSGLVGEELLRYLERLGEDVEPSDAPAISRRELFEQRVAEKREQRQTAAEASRRRIPGR